MFRKYFLLLLFIFLVGCSSESFVTIGFDKTFVEIADSPEELSRGLMFREELCEDCGMLFIFDEEREHSFWMKNTLIPLDMVFINENLEVVALFHADPCLTEQCEHYRPEQTSKYVLETNVNKFDESIIGKKVTIRI
jgi:hypothetical protein|tara:strand:+ start:75 stop:485 length:411 start_codon:yes stop_codon:yes gene_type:complete